MGMVDIMGRCVQHRGVGLYCVYCIENQLEVELGANALPSIVGVRSGGSIWCVVTPFSSPLSFCLFSVYPFSSFNCTFKLQPKLVFLPACGLRMLN